ncbi:MAG: N-acyl-D-amino-acid deacylase [Planctomycetota bacterium]
MNGVNPLPLNYDVLITGGRIVDGAGNPWFFGDVAVAGDRVAAVAPRGQLNPTLANEVIDASGQVVCPGFIDIQSHSLRPLFSSGRVHSKVTQGVTTEIMGEGSTPAPFGGRIEAPSHADPGSPWYERIKTWTRFRAWLEAIEERGASVNIGSFLGGGTLRAYACGWDMEKATSAQVETMCRVTAECMQEGAFGVATALIYPPGSFAQTDELIEIGKVIGQYGGVYITHVRSEGAGLLEGIAEAIEIGRCGGCAVEIYHLKASGKQNWHLMPKAIDLIESARAEGIDVTADMYPYPASGTGLNALIPEWAYEGHKLFERLRDPSIREKLKKEMLTPDDFRAKTADHVMPVGFKKAEHKKFLGKRMDEIARLRGQDWPEAVMDLILAEEDRIFTVYFTMSEDNLKLQLRLPWIKISTDAGGEEPSAEPKPGHPRGFGTYPRVLGKYVREERVLSLEDAVRKMTSSVANRLGLTERGTLRPGQFADVVIFDPATIGDRATFENSKVLSVGVRDVWVNGTRVLKNGEHTNAMPGRIVDGPGRKVKHG